jgi:hypothetical protein
MVKTILQSQDVNAEQHIAPEPRAARIRDFVIVRRGPVNVSVRRMRRRLRGQSLRGRGVRAPFHKQGDQLDGFSAKVASYAMEI